MKLAHAFTSSIVLLTLAATGLAQESHGAAGHANAADHAAHGHEVVGAMPTPDQGMWTGITAIAVFILTAVFLHMFVWPKISKGLKDREDKIRNSIEEAEMAQQQARQALEQYEKNLASARAEAQKMLDDAKTQQQAITAELKAKADVELAQLRDKAKRDIDSAKAAAIAEIHSHATSLATTMAGKILKREINAGDQQRMIQESLQEMGASRN